MGDDENVRKNGPMVLLVAALTFLGVRSFTPESAPPFKTSSETQKEPRSAQEQDGNAAADRSANDTKRFWQPLLDHYDASAESELAKQIDKLPDLHDDVRCLIACVPHPIDSTSAYRFDGLIDAMQRAAERKGWVLDRYFYPWPRRMKNAPIEAAVQEFGLILKYSPLGINLILKYPPLIDHSEHQPGVLLLRNTNNDPSSRLLLIFLVGEMATTGLDKKAFAASLHLIKKSKEHRDSKMIRVVGPFFSGSQLSLEQTIRTWAEREKGEKPTFRVISGDATSIDKEKLRCNCAPAKVIFDATALPDVSVFAALLEHLDLGSRLPNGQFTFKGDFAVLYESNTTFGQRAAGPSDRHKGSGTGPTFFPFPLHVSEVRSAYNKTTNSTRETALRLPSFGSKLPARADDGNYPRDVEPSLDSPWTAVTSERLLGEMLETISRERFRYVFIVATDVRDQLFLAGLVRQHCPESRLVFTNSDLLFTHPDYSADLRGSLVGSSYPIYDRNQRWSFPFRGAERRFFFPGPGEQGCYNAVLALLDRESSGDLIEYGPPFLASVCSADADKLSQDLSKGPIDRRRPPVWISIIGQGGLYPLSAIPARLARDKDGKEIDSYRDYVFRAAALQDEQTFQPEFVPLHTGLWIVPVLGMTLLLIYVGRAYSNVLKRSAEWTRGRARESGTAMQQLLWPRSRRLRRAQQFYAGVCLASVLIVYAYFVFVWMIPFVHWWFPKSPVKVRLWHWIMPAVLLALLAWFVLLLFQRARLGRRGGFDPLEAAVPERPRVPETSPRPLSEVIVRYRIQLLCVLMLLIMAVYLTVNGWPPHVWRDGEGLLFAERASSLASGVTPVVPILFLGLAFYCWGYCQLKRLYLLDEHAVPLCSLAGQPRFEQIDRRHGELVRNLKAAKKSLSGKWIWLLWVMLFFVFSRLSSHFIPTAEDIFTESALLLSLAVLAVLIVYGWLHLRKVWESTRHLLNAVALLPLHEAFRRVPDAITKMFGPYLSSQRPGRQEHLSYRLLQRRFLVEAYERISDDLRAAVPLTAMDNAALAAAMQLAPANRGISLTPAQPLPAAAQACLLVLEHIWRDCALAERLLEKFPVEEKDKSETSPSSLPALVIHKTVRNAAGATAQTIDETVTGDAQAAEKAIRCWLTQARDFVALEMTVYLSQFFVHLRNLTLFLTVAPLLMLLAVTSYPFQPQRLWLYLAMALIGTTTLTVISIVLGIERHELVSRIVKTTPNQLNFHWGFFSHFVFYAAPLLGILVAMSSDLSNLVHAWVDPLLQALR